ncbi:MAG: sterol desaturase family protein [Bacteroidetes bacterium]|nr:sterol desaturase family protein [Bacteroidota bacterium]
MNFNPVVLSIPIYFLLIAIELLIQQFSKKKLYRLNDAVTNISCGITQQLTGTFLIIFAIGIYQLIYEHLAIFIIPSNAFTLILLFVLVDFAYYWAHRMSHEINLLWGSHVVHHQSEDYNFSVALRQSSLQVIWTSFFYLPLALIGFNTLDFALMVALSTVYQFWIHTETIKKLGPLEYIFNTPSHHRVHHGRDPKYIDKNLAGVLITWDMLFGTFQKEEEKPCYGITRRVKTWNPVWANLDHYVFMWSDLKKIRGLQNKIKYVFYKPGWYPEELGGYQAAPPVDKHHFEKFDTRSFPAVNYYVLFQFILTLAGTAFFLFNKSSFNLNESAFIVFLIIITIVNCGALFEFKNWVLSAEKVRITLFTGIMIFLSFANAWDVMLLTTGLVYFLVSMVWLFNIDFNRSEVAEI